MGQKFLRQVVLTTEAGTFTELKIGFTVDKSVSGKPNTAEIKIYNLTAAHRQTLKKELGEITLECGHRDEGNLGIVFKGFIRDSLDERISKNILTTISCGDGDKAFRKSYISKTYPKNTPIKDIIIDVQGKMEGVDLGEIKLPDEVTPSKRAMSFSTTPQNVLNELSRTYKFFWSIQNGKLEVIPGDGSLKNVTYITPQTGLLGTPSITDSGIVVKCLLDPNIRPNRIVNIQSKTTDEIGASGEYRVSSVSYGGDNWDGDFYIQLEAELLKDGKTKEK